MMIVRAGLQIEYSTWNVNDINAPEGIVMYNWKKHYTSDAWNDVSLIVISG